MKDIKEKNTDKTIKTFNKKEAITHTLKQATITTKKHTEKVQSKEDSEDGGKQAIHHVTSVEQQVAVKAKHHAKRLFVRRKETIKKKRQRAKSESSKQTGSNASRMKQIKGKENVRAHFQSGRGNMRSNIADRAIKTEHSYQQHMRIFHLRKKQQKMQEATLSTTKKGTSILHKVIGSFRNLMGKVVMNMNTLLGAGGALIILTIFLLFIGIFASLAGGSNDNTATDSIAPEVYAYSEQVEKYTKQYGIPEYKNLVYAVMMQESGGKESDPMQASECVYNEKFPKKSNGIEDPEYSIDVGVHCLADSLKQAGAKDPADISGISLSLQGYNYGNGYIDWALQHFKGYTRANAKVFSDEKKRELKTTIYGDPDYVPHVLRYYHLGNGNLVMIAKTQVGNVGGKLYWSWYGYTSRVEWCACFVSWVANEAGLLEQGKVPKFSNCEAGIKWFKEQKKWEGKGSIPQSGYIIFFDWDNDGIGDHVGIVERIEGNIIHTIEGNSLNDECRRREYNIKSIYIVGFAITR